MKTLRDVINQSLIWARPGTLKSGITLKLEYELRAGSEVAATLRWQKLIGSLALAETADGAWTFKRAGFLHPRVTVRAANAENDLAVFKPNWLGGGSLEVPNGTRRPWVTTNFWGSVWAFTDEAGQPLVQFIPKFTVMNPAAEVKINPMAVASPEIPLLVCLGWYLLILTAEDGSAAAGMAVTSA